MYSIIWESDPDEFTTLDFFTLDQVMDRYSNYYVDLDKIRFFLEHMKPGQYIILGIDIIIKSGQYLDIWASI